MLCVCRSVFVASLYDTNSHIQTVERDKKQSSISVGFPLSLHRLTVDIDGFVLTADTSHCLFFLLLSLFSLVHMFVSLFVCLFALAANCLLQLVGVLALQRNSFTQFM